MPGSRRAPAKSPNAAKLATAVSVALFSFFYFRIFAWSRIRSGTQTQSHTYKCPKPLATLPSVPASNPIYSLAYVSLHFCFSFTICVTYCSWRLGMCLCNDSHANKTHRSIVVSLFSTSKTSVHLLYFTHTTNHSPHLPLVIDDASYRIFFHLRQHPVLLRRLFTCQHRTPLR